MVIEGGYFVSECALQEIPDVSRLPSLFPVLPVSGKKKDPERGKNCYTTKSLSSGELVFPHYS